MAHSLSAKKRIRQNESRRALNRWRKRRFRRAMREYDETILHGSLDQAKEELSQLYKILDQVAAKGAIHKNTAARHKSRLAKKFTKKAEAATPE